MVEQSTAGGRSAWCIRPRRSWRSFAILNRVVSPTAAQARRHPPLLLLRFRPTLFVQRPRPASTTASFVAGDLRAGLDEAAGRTHRGPGAGTRTGCAVVERLASGKSLLRRGDTREWQVSARWPTDKRERVQRLAGARHGAEVLLRRAKVVGWSPCMCWAK